MSFNKICLIGNLGKDPEVKTFDNGNSVTKFTLATSETYKDKQGQKQTETEWHNITAWGKLGEICSQYLKKGSKIYAEGQLKSRKYDANGETRTAYEITLKEMRMLGEKQESNNRFVKKPGAALPSNIEFDDEIPF